MGYIPWRRLASWNCNNCGHCCRTLKVFLWKGEADQLISIFGNDVVEEESRGMTLRKRAGRCYFNRNWEGSSRCLLQNTGIKPSACRVFPFLALAEPIRPETASEASFEHRGQTIYVYANSMCPSCEPGRPGPHLSERVLPEVARIALDGYKEQKYSTGVL